MRFEVYTINGLHGVKRSYKTAMALSKDLPANCSGRFAILVKDRKNAYPHTSYKGKDGVCYQSTMLLYPPDSKCQKFKPNEYVQSAVTDGKG